jgi:hypothetical protein
VFRGGFQSRLLALVLEHQGNAHAALGDETAARAAFADALEQLGARDAEGRARLLAEIASSHERSGDRAAAAERWREVWTRHATSAEAARAETALERLASEDRALVYRTASAWQERCQRLSAALRNEEALVSCDAALALAPGERSMLRARADLLFRMRRYPDAVEAFGALGAREADAVFWQARSLARAGRIDDALASFAHRARPDRALSARARFLAGTLLEDSDLTAAEASYRAVATARPAPRPERRRLAARLAGLAAGRLRRRRERLAADQPTPGELARRDYWLGRALERMDAPKAEAAGAAGPR